MNNIVNYKLKDFISKTEQEITEYLNIIKYIKPIDTKLDIFSMTLRDVQAIKDYATAGTFEDLIATVMITEELEYKDVINMKIVSFWGKVLSIKEQLETINHQESVALTSETPNFKWEAVDGSNRMSKFGIYNTLDNLSGGDILKYEAILNLPYSDVFTKMYMNRVKGDIEQEMNKLKTNK